MNTTATTEKDKQMAQHCVECPVCTHARRSSAGSLIGSSKLSRIVYAHTVRRMKRFTGKRPMRLDRGN